MRLGPSGKLRYSADSLKRGRSLCIKRLIKFILLATAVSLLGIYLKGLVGEVKKRFMINTLM